ncbi:hypothetical protein Ancab_016973, partial [Ancistrocladus abbreviatus]
MLPQQSVPAALGGRPTEHEDNAGRNMESGGQLASHTHACAHASLGDRGTSVERTVVPKENAVMNLESGEQLSAHNLEFCSHVNPLDLDPRNTKVHAVVRRLERGVKYIGYCACSVHRVCSAIMGMKRITGLRKKDIFWGKEGPV